ncbi:MAG: hypothetical protein JSR33_05715 [Proteobacteria bacterium]|nr:hypothetical protein [Pseudomonadota bacterium]
MKFNHSDSIISPYLDRTIVSAIQLVQKVQARLTELEEYAHQWYLITLPLIAFLQYRSQKREEMSARLILLIELRIAGLVSFEDANANLFFSRVSAWKDHMMQRPFAQISPAAQEMRKVIGMLCNTVRSYQSLLQRISQNNKLIYLAPLAIARDQLEQHLTEAREDFDQELAKYLNRDQHTFNITLQSIRQAQSTCIQIRQARRSILIAEAPLLPPLDNKYNLALSTTTQKKRKHQALQPCTDFTQGKEKRIPDSVLNSTTSLMIQRGMWQHSSLKISSPGRVHHRQQPSV